MDWNEMKCRAHQGAAAGVGPVKLIVAGADAAGVGIGPARRGGDALGRQHRATLYEALQALAARVGAVDVARATAARVGLSCANLLGGNIVVEHGVQGGLAAGWGKEGGGEKRVGERFSGRGVQYKAKQV